LSNSAISIRYAKALLNIAAEKQGVEQYADELAQVATLFQREDVLRLLLDSPTFPVEKKAAIMSDVADKLQVGEGMKNFLGLLVEKGRVAYLAQIQQNYRKFADEKSGLVRASLLSASELSGERTEAIKQGLEKQTGKQVVLSVDVDESLIGGLQAEMGGKLFDGSVKTQLKRMTDTLAKG